MFTTEINISKIDKLIEGKIRDIDRAASIAMRDALREAAQYARTHHLHKRRTGNLTSVRHMRGELLGRTGRTVHGRLINTAPYASFVERGTMPHKIVTRNAKALRFYWKGVLTFRKSVNHPGGKAYPFIKPAAALVRPLMKKKLPYELRRARTR